MGSTPLQKVATGTLQGLDPPSVRLSLHPLPPTPMRLPQPLPNQNRALIAKTPTISVTSPVLDPSTSRFSPKIWVHVEAQSRNFVCFRDGQRQPPSNSVTPRLTQEVFWE